MEDNVYLDVSVIRCPYCGKLYTDSSWYVIDMESDIQCNICGNTFNTRKNLIDRVLIKFRIKEDKIIDVTIDKRLT